jgi:hypothetical protein
MADFRRVDLCSSPQGGIYHAEKSELIFVLVLKPFIRIIHFIIIILKVDALLKTLELRESVKCTGHFALYNCLVLGHTKYKGGQRVYCNPFPQKTLYGSHRMDLVMIRPQGIDNGAFIVSPDTVWCAGVLLLFSAASMTDTGSKSFDCALVMVSTLETYDGPENGNCIIPVIIIFSLLKR